jgi:hypothetical protein
MKKIQKVAVLSTLSLSLTLIITAGWVLVTPITVYASSCCAKCGPAPDVCCSGSGTCSATDGWGCRASNGSYVAPMIRLCEVY